MQTLPASAPAAGTLPAGSTPSPAPLTTTITPAAGQVTIPNTPGGGPLYAIGAHEADDELLKYASTLGPDIAKELGLTAEGALPVVKKEGETVGQGEGEKKGAAAPAGTTPAGAAGTTTETPEAKVARLELELKALKDAGAVKGPAAAAGDAPPALTPPVVAPTMEHPLANLRSADHLTHAETVASRVKAWAIEHRDGGTLPLELAQLVEDGEAARFGRQPVKIAEAPVIPKEGAAQIESMADQMLTRHIPHRRDFLGQQTQAIEILRQQSPEYLDTTKEEGKLLAGLAQRFPGILANPLWPLVLADTAAGYLARMKKVGSGKAEGGSGAVTPVQTPAPGAAATVPDAQGKIIPMAPAAPIGGLAAGGPPVSQKALDDAQARLNAGTHSDEDLYLLSANAV